MLPRLTTPKQSHRAEFGENKPLLLKVDGVRHCVSAMRKFTKTGERANRRGFGSWDPTWQVGTAASETGEGEEGGYSQRRLSQASKLSLRVMLGDTHGGPRMCLSSAQAGEHSGCEGRIVRSVWERGHQSLHAMVLRAPEKMLQQSQLHITR